MGDEYDDEISSIEKQLQSTLKADIARALQKRRPLLTHLNADTTWLLSLPIPIHSADPDPDEEKNNPKRSREPGKLEGEKSERNRYFHILIDPWLRGSQSDIAHFFSRQWHATPSAVQTIEEVEEVITRIEQLASLSLTCPFSGAVSCAEKARGEINAVVVSHEFTDHMHRETLLEVSPSVPVFAPGKAAGIIRSWKHFEVVVTLGSGITASGNRDWRSVEMPELPSWLRISRLGADKVGLLYYHSAVMFAFLSASREDENDDDEHGHGRGRGHETDAVIYTPHGISPSDSAPLAAADPPIRTLAVLHGLHDISIGGQLNLGAHNGLKVQRLTRAKYWVGTHDEVKKGQGVVSWFLKRDVLSLKEALERELEERGEKVENLDDVHFVELGNGESLLLE